MFEQELLVCKFIYFFSISHNPPRSDEVHQFEVKMRKSYSVLEEGVEVSMWQLNRKMNLGPEESRDEFALKSSAVHVKLNRRGDLLVQSNLTFITKGGYLSKALGRRRSKLLNEILSFS